MLIHERDLLDRRETYRAYRDLLRRHRYRRCGRRSGNRLGALLVPDVGERELLDDMLNARDRTLKLFKNNVTPAEADTTATYTVADFGGYVDKTLAGASWNAASTASGTTSKTYAQQTWTCAGSGNTIYGAYYIRSATLCATDLFATARVIADTDVLNFTPKWQLD
jgi:hypothetical protein